MKKRIVLIATLVMFTGLLYAQYTVMEKKDGRSFPLVSASGATPVIVDDKDHWLVQKAAAFLQADIDSITGKKPALLNQYASAGRNIILIGSLDHSALISELVAVKKIQVDKIRGKWEAYHVQVIANPFPGIDNALVITGSDRRGTAFGVLELSQKIGVSPWYWWADVPVKKKKELHVQAGIYQQDAPSVKYRGIFLNDEAPALSGWTREKFGGFNSKFYEKVFELLLRLKANYLWPAMWGSAFNDDDTINPILADKYGIVMGTSHHEPMLRAQTEWRRYGKGQWNYQSNDTVLRNFWKKGIENMGTHESIVSIGMRGDGDMPMTQGSNIALLERIVADQRKIIGEVTGKPASATPQLWALYKEVQDYYDKGMRVPDDVTLLLCDDNWGNIRKLPKLSDAPRKGGYGIYYHFDYVGGPRNYKWLNTNPIARTWEQMHLAWEYNVKNIWIVNVGDLKPMELPISFFLDYAWKPDAIKATELQRYTERWAAEQFGSTHAVAIADILSKYTKFNGRRKPELLDANTYSRNYNEAENVTKEYTELFDRAEKINNALPARYRDAYFQLVLHPVKACANLQEMYTAVADNKWWAKHGSPRANQYADKVKQLYLQDSLISKQYHEIANGKWNHMMDQTHIGYTYWQQPNRQKMPDVTYVPANTVEAGNDSAAIATKTALSLVPLKSNAHLFYERSGYVSIEAAHYTKAVNSSLVRWQVLPDHGRTGSAITPFPVTAAAQTPGGNAPHLAYEVYLYTADSVKLQAYFSPTLNFHNNAEGLQYAVSIDDEQPQLISINKEDNNNRIWEGWVANSIIIKTTRHQVRATGKHVVRYWMVSPGVVLQKLVMDLGGVKQSFLGPPETKR